jgi:hypothetical protein
VLPERRTDTRTLRSLRPTQTSVETEAFSKAIFANEHKSYSKYVSVGKAILRSKHSFTIKPWDITNKQIILLTKRRKRFILQKILDNAIYGVYNFIIQTYNVNEEG